MNYYERHLGDYARDTAHLTMVEHGAYTVLLDRYYTTESGIPEEQAHRVTRARTKEEKQAVDTVLSEFFLLENGLWIKNRVQEEITKAQSKIRAAKENGLKGGRPKHNQTETQDKPSGLSVGSKTETQDKALQTPDTRYQTPDTSNQVLPNSKPIKNKNTALVAPDCIFPEIKDRQIVTDWLAIRKAKDAPATRTALEGVAREVRKAGIQIEDAIRMCCERNWSGFKSTWLEHDVKAPSGMTYHEKTTNTANQIFGRKPNGTGNQIIDITPTQAARSGAEDIPAVCFGVRSSSA